MTDRGGVSIPEVVWGTGTLNEGSTEDGQSLSRTAATHRMNEPASETPTRVRRLAALRTPLRGCSPRFRCRRPPPIRSLSRLPVLVAPALVLKGAVRSMQRAARALGPRRRYPRPMCGRTRLSSEMSEAAT